MSLSLRKSITSTSNIELKDIENDEVTLEKLEEMEKMELRKLDRIHKEEEEIHKVVDKLEAEEQEELSKLEHLHAKMDALREHVTNTSVVEKKGIRLTALPEQYRHLAAQHGSSDSDHLDEVELGNALRAFAEQNKLIKTQRNAIFALVVFMFVCMISFFFLTITAVEVAKDMRPSDSDNGTLKMGDGTIVKVGSSDFEVDEKGVLRKRTSTTESGSINLQASNNALTVSNKITTPIGNLVCRNFGTVQCRVGNIPENLDIQQFKLKSRTAQTVRRLDGGEIETLNSGTIVAFGYSGVQSSSTVSTPPSRRSLPTVSDNVHRGQTNAKIDLRGFEWNFHNTKSNFGGNFFPRRLGEVKDGVERKLTQVDQIQLKVEDVADGVMVSSSACSTDGTTIVPMVKITRTQETGIVEQIVGSHVCNGEAFVGFEVVHGPL